MRVVTSRPESFRVRGTTTNHDREGSPAGRAPGRCGRRSARADVERRRPSPVGDARWAGGSLLLLARRVLRGCLGLCLGFGGRLRRGGPGVLRGGGGRGEGGGRGRRRRFRGGA